MLNSTCAHTVALHLHPRGTMPPGLLHQVERPVQRNLPRAGFHLQSVQCASTTTDQGDQLPCSCTLRIAYCSWCSESH